MRVEPDLPDFAARYDSGRPQVVWTTIVADLETPVSAMLKLADGRPYSFLLESVEGGATRGRYSIIGLKPDLIWRCAGDAAEINRRARFDPDAFVKEPPGALASLRRLVQVSRIDVPERLPPMASALVGYMGYEMVRLIERLPTAKPAPLGLPDGLFVRPTVMAIFDNVGDAVTVVTPMWPEPGTTARAAYNVACERLADTVADLERALPHGRGGGEDDAPGEPVSNTPRETYFEMVRKAKDYIAAGDVFQVVLSQRFAIPFRAPPFSLYRALRRVNPSPFLFFLDFADFAVVGSSPEILVRARDGVVTLRPIAGTRPRGATRAEDQALAADLLADPKELAEHLMLLDLGRNDVGRVAKIGSVTVTERNIIEYYSHVMHIVSNVEGRLDPRFDALDALMAGFPAGTVSGAPKVRAMEIIDELEVERRGIYAGGVGYFSASGAMDSCIALRTAVVKDGTLYIQAGGGIVADSTPEGEYQEARNKARALVRAAEVALAFDSGEDRRNR
ncbi:MAG: anthranilate synthase component I [Alphaproteobacteria bacterium]